MKCIFRPCFSFLSNDTPLPPLNLRVKNQKSTLWSNWAWPWSRQSCLYLGQDSFQEILQSTNLFHPWQTPKTIIHFLLILKLSLPKIWSISKLEPVTIRNNCETSMLHLAASSCQVYLTRISMVQCTLRKFLWGSHYFPFSAAKVTLQSQVSVCPSVHHRNPSASQNCSYRPSSLLTIWAYRPLSLSTIEPIDHRAYWP